MRTFESYPIPKVMVITALAGSLAFAGYSVSHGSDNCQAISRVSERAIRPASYQLGPTGYIFSSISGSIEGTQHTGTGTVVKHDDSYSLIANSLPGLNYMETPDGFGNQDVAVVIGSREIGEIGLTSACVISETQNSKTTIFVELPTRRS